MYPLHDSETAMHRGFSIVELIVVVAIFTVISTIVLVNHRSFQSTVVVSSLAYDVALSIRQAQVFGLGVRGVSGTFDVAHGINFDTDRPSSYILFADRNEDNRYTAAQDTIVKTFELNRGFAVKDVCGVSGGSPSCASSGGSKILDIVFVRPEPDAVIQDGDGISYDDAEITISSPPPANEERIITVLSTGQIATGRSPAAAASSGVWMVKVNPNFTSCVSGGKNPDASVGQACSPIVDTNVAYENRSGADGLCEFAPSSKRWQELACKTDTGKTWQLASPPAGGCWVPQFPMISPGDPCYVSGATGYTNNLRSCGPGNLGSTWEKYTCTP